MAYVLVILRGGANADEEQVYSSAHERFITSLIEQNLVLLGGAFAAPAADAFAAYVLRCDSADHARAIASQDPFVLHDVVRLECVEWELVGINPEAIDPAAVVRPDDV